MSEITRLDLLAGQFDLPALTPEIQAPQKVFGINLGFWKLCLEARKIRNEEKDGKAEQRGNQEVAGRDPASGKV